MSWIFRWQVVKGKRVHFRPGWDCHGLPIELKAVKGGNSESTQNPLNIRSVARTFARQTIERQKAEFVSWGVMADWDNPYVTMDPDCVKQEIKAFFQLFKKGFVYQSYMPGQFQIASTTILQNVNNFLLTIFVWNLSVLVTLIADSFGRVWVGVQPITSKRLCVCQIHPGSSTIFRQTGSPGNLWIHT